MSLHFSWACLICPPLILPRGSGQKQKLKAASAGDKEGTPPPGAWFAPCSSAARVQPRGCKGRSPLHKKTKSLPLPAGKSALRARVGGISFPFGEGGQKSKLKAGATGNQEGKPPRRVPARHGHPATIRASPLPAWQKTPPHSGTPCGAPPQGGENAESSG